jgi:hypothetical protein
MLVIMTWAASRALQRSLARAELHGQMAAFETICVGKPIPARDPTTLTHASRIRPPNRKACNESRLTVSE